MKSDRNGFTLIELSIVLVIIGLIVGGVLVGQDLIKAAEVRATISQIEKYNTAVNTFKGKFNALPGDITSSAATAFGFSSTAHNGNNSTSGQGDGNGVIDGAEGVFQIFFSGAGQTISYSQATGETGVFWMDLSSDVGGHLIDGTFSASNETNEVLLVSNSQIPQYIPAAKLGRGNYVYVMEINYINSFGIENLVNFHPVPLAGTTMTVAQAFSIDSKMDDSFPTTGTVVALGNAPMWAIGNYPTNNETYVPSGSLFSGVVGTAGNASSATTCFDAGAGTTPTYSMEQNSGAGPNCALMIRFQ